MDDGRLDLSSLRPDPERIDRAAGAVLARARASLDGRRRAQSSVWGELSAWQRPLLVTAATAALLSITVLFRVHPAVPGGHPATLSEEAGVPAPFAPWVDSDQAPDPASLLEW